VPVGAHDDVPAVVVDHAMMPSAQEDQVRQIGCATVDPVLQMMGLGPCGWSAAAGKRTAVVASDECAALLRGHQSLAASEV